MIEAQLVKALREKTGAGVMDCKIALEEAGGDAGLAVDILRKKGKAQAAKKSERKTKEGVIASYIHLGGKIGVLVEINCETDFVAKNEDFRQFVKDITMQIAACSPTYAKKEDVPENVLAKEKEILRAQVDSSGKPAGVIDKIVEGRLTKFYSESCLLEQPFIRDPNTTIKNCLTEMIAKLGENIVIRRFARFQVGEEL